MNEPANSPDDPASDRSMHLHPALAHGHGHAVPPHPHVTGLSIASLLLGLIGIATLLLLFIGLLPAVGALICGHLALIRIRLSKGRLRGRTPAVIGLVAGYLTIFMAPVMAIAAVVGFPHLDEYFRQGQETVRLDHASALYRACEDFSRDHGGDYPTAWNNLEGRYLSDRELDFLLMTQHGSGWSNFKSLVLRQQPAKRIDGPAFRLVPHERPVLRELEGSVVVIKEVAPPDVERIVVAYDNGETTMIANPERE